MRISTLSNSDMDEQLEARDAHNELTGRAKQIVIKQRARQRLRVAGRPVSDEVYWARKDARRSRVGPLAMYNPPQPLCPADRNKAKAARRAASRG